MANHLEGASHLTRPFSRFDILAGFAACSTEICDSPVPASAEPNLCSTQSLPFPSRLQRSRMCVEFYPASWVQTPVLPSTVYVICRPPSRDYLMTLSYY